MFGMYHTLGLVTVDSALHYIALVGGLLLLAWCLVALVVGLLVSAAIHLADRYAPRLDKWRHDRDAA